MPPFWPRELTSRPNRKASQMTTDALRERGDSLEEAFFRNMDRKLIGGTAGEERARAADR